MKILTNLLAFAALSLSALAETQLPEGLGLPDRFVAAARVAYAKPEYSAYQKSLMHTPQFAKWNGRADLPAGGVVRWVDVGGIANFRDIGGWNGLNTGKVWRGSESNCHSEEHQKKLKSNFHNLSLTPAGRDTMSKQLRIKTDLDLRGAWESPTPDETPVPGANLVRIACSSYTNFLRQTEKIAALMRVFADPANYPIYFHCYGGADRTGSLAFLLEGLCGVNEIDLSIDYELTSFSRIGFRTRDINRYYFYAEMVAEMKTRPGKTLSEKIAHYLTKECGLSDAEIKAIRRQLMPGYKG